jgi:hypothetical protein
LLRVSIWEKRKNAEGKLKGDMLRELILLVHLNNKYGKGKNKIPELREIVGYNSPGGIYSALDNSGFFKRTRDEIKLTEKGEQYLNREIMPRYNILQYVGDAFIVIGVTLFFQWIVFTFFHYVWLPAWYAGLSVFVGGLVLRFLILRLNYWEIRRKKKMVGP